MSKLVLIDLHNHGGIEHLCDRVGLVDITDELNITAEDHWSFCEGPESEISLLLRFSHVADGTEEEQIWIVKATRSSKLTRLLVSKEV